MRWKCPFGETVKSEETADKTWACDKWQNDEWLRYDVAGMDGFGVFLSNIMTLQAGRKMLKKIHTISLKGPRVGFSLECSFELCVIYFQFSSCSSDLIFDEADISRGSSDPMPP